MWGSLCSVACSTSAPQKLADTRRSRCGRRATGSAARCAAQANGGSGGSSGSTSGSGPCDCSSELPPELQGLQISEDGKELIDTSTGKVINEFGATRFDVAVRAMRGEFDPPAYADNTERGSGVLLDSLVQFPALHEFNLVVKQPADSSSRRPPQELLDHYRRVVADTTAADIPADTCTVKERIGGKFVSLCIPARVQAAHVVDLVWQALADDPAVIMKY